MICKLHKKNPSPTIKKDWPTSMYIFVFCLRNVWKYIVVKIFLNVLYVYLCVYNCILSLRRGNMFLLNPPMHLSTKWHFRTDVHYMEDIPICKAFLVTPRQAIIFVRFDVLRVKVGLICCPIWCVGWREYYSQLCHYALCKALH